MTGQHRTHWSVGTDHARRGLQVLVGTSVMGIGVALLVRAESGLVPTDILHVGLATRAGWSVGAGIITVQTALLVLGLALRIRPGIGTVAGVVIPGLTCNGALDVLSPATTLWQRGEFWTSGAAAFAVGAALYLAAGLGANPRDGLMLKISAGTGLPVGRVRVVLDAATLIVGVAIAGPITAVHQGLIGIGSIPLVFLTGPAIQLLLRLLRFAPPRAAGAGTHLDHRFEPPPAHDGVEPARSDPHGDVDSGSV